MRAVVQRVLSAELWVEGQRRAAIGPGLLVFWGLAKGDTPGDEDYLRDKILNLRIFPDEQGRMNRSVQEAGGEVLLVSQFTLYGDVRRGRRPGFDQALPPAEAQAWFSALVERFLTAWPRTQCGVFGADMRIPAENDGPVTILLDSAKLF